MRVIYLLQASTSVSNEWRPIFHRKRERERKIHKVESRREKEKGSLKALKLKGRKAVTTVWYAQRYLPQILQTLRIRG
ncbi:hypothetical protein EVAR_36945_1 [Eumeta japonica]|uniref:Uncharacterized protein n=1 Tax=Eumeta variegata TaxID=151549 RepID=A0A4C1W9D4_EUMVA|nr:hypothetical protein EVAR_36945_1 [Eumeta japonica]